MLGTNSLKCLKWPGPAELWMETGPGCCAEGLWIHPVLGLTPCSPCSLPRFIYSGSPVKINGIICVSKASGSEVLIPVIFFFPLLYLSCFHHLTTSLTIKPVMFSDFNTPFLNFVSLKSSHISTPV